jgi:hypothetical protein
MLGAISAKAANMMAEPEISHFFIRLIQRVAPKSYAQAAAEVSVTQKFLENFGGDQVHLLSLSTLSSFLRSILFHFRFVFLLGRLLFLEIMLDKCQLVIGAKFNSVLC